MIKGNILNGGEVAGLPSAFATLFEFLRTHDLSSTPCGRIEVSGNDIYINVMEPATSPADGRLLEAHRDYFDVHILIHGAESIGLKDTDTCTQVSSEYDKAGDCILFADEPVTVFSLEEGEFAIIGPEEAHLPAIGNGQKIKKAVAKIRI